MAITLEDVDRIASLARLRFTPEEKQKLVRQLGEIIAYVAKLNELDTHGVAPMHHVMNLTNVLREDDPRAALSADEATANAPDRIDGYFGVPKVIDQDPDAQ